MPCTNCRGKCCVGLIDVYPEDIIFNEETLVQMSTNPKYEKEMKLKDGNVCIALVDGKCSIYEKRPQVCRDFAVNGCCCVLFQLGVKTAHESEVCMYDRS